MNSDGRLIYSEDSLGNRIPDFSYAGYRASEQAIPYVESVVFVRSQPGDATSVIQKAIDYVSELPIDANGFRGAVQLDKGTFILDGRLIISASGVVMRGKGMEEGGTTLVAGGKDRQTLITVAGTNDYIYDDAVEILDDYVPVNASVVTVADGSLFEVGDQVIVHRASEQNWIEFLGMDRHGGRETEYIGWKPGQRDIKLKRTVLEKRGNQLILDVPLTHSLDRRFGESHVIPIVPNGRIQNVGIEGLRLISQYDVQNEKDEDHCFSAITFEYVRDAWVRQIEFRHFAGSAVAVYETGSRITVEDCISRAPVSEIGNWRRYTFFTMGQQTLFQRLYAEHGFHDFAVGFMAAGPNVFVECESYLPYNFSGTIDSWASGVLFDIVKIDGHRLAFSNRDIDNQGAGWTAANSVFWQCAADRIENHAPPGTMNWAFGVWGQFAGNGYWDSQNNHVNPRSLFYAQLANRLEKDASVYADEVRPVPGFASTSPTLKQAKELTKDAYSPHLRMDDWIAERIKKAPLKTSSQGKKIVLSETSDSDKLLIGAKTAFEIRNGFIAFDGALMTGKRHNVPWWRGVARPYEAENRAQPAITRFVPGRYGHGYTDHLHEVVTWMENNGVIGIEHNYGLWYDRRRDDHQRVRRMDGDVWAPFYEQPFTRSGKGTAWDGLSKYDLTRFNYFYWSRLREFSQLASNAGRVLLHQHFFQHNILEAGAHWSDSPWRPVNNINNTGFIEPVNYAGDKRIFIDEQFYDLSCEDKRHLYRNYIRKCLDNFEEGLPVLHLISAEYTGPLHFVEFWLDTIEDWQNETGQMAYVVLSVTKDVQDAILSHSKRSAIIDVIDIRYWAYRKDGTLFAPEGGKHLAPRQHARIESSGKRSFNSVYRSVSEYKKQFPEKAVIYSDGQYDRYGWATLMAGGSLAALPEGLSSDLKASVLSMTPISEKIIPEKLYLLQNNQAALVYADGIKTLDIDIDEGSYEVQFLNISNGQIIKKSEFVANGNKLTVKNDQNSAVVIWVKKI